MSTDLIDLEDINPRQISVWIEFLSDAIACKILHNGKPLIIRIKNSFVKSYNYKNGINECHITLTNLQCDILDKLVDRMQFIFNRQLHSLIYQTKMMGQNSERFPGEHYLLVRTRSLDRIEDYYNIIIDFSDCHIATEIMIIQKQLVELERIQLEA